MATFHLKNAVQAVRYELGVNEQEVMALVRATGRSGMSMDNMRGFLRIYNNGPELHIHAGDWVVGIGGTVAVMDDARFTELFVPA